MFRGVLGLSLACAKGGVHNNPEGDVTRLLWHHCGNGLPGAAQPDDYTLAQEDFVVPIPGQRGRAPGDEGGYSSLFFGDDSSGTITPGGWRTVMFSRD